MQREFHSVYLDIAAADGDNERPYRLASKE